MSNSKSPFEMSPNFPNMRENRHPNKGRRNKYAHHYAGRAFCDPEFFDGPARFVKERAEKVGGRYAQVMDRLCDLGTKRLGEMDAAGIDMQVLSLSAPGVEQMEPADAIAMARDTNDYLADAVKKYPTRFAGLAAMPTRSAEPGRRRTGTPCPPRRLQRCSSSMVTIVGDISTIKFTGRFWNAPRRSMFRSISIQPHRRNR